MRFACGLKGGGGCYIFTVDLSILFGVSGPVLYFFLLVSFLLFFFDPTRHILVSFILHAEFGDGDNQL